MAIRKWVIGVLLGCLSGAVAGPITFQQVSNSNDGYLDDYVAPAYNDNGEVAFWGSYAGNANSGIFSASAPANGVVGPLSTVVDSSGIYSGFTHGQVDINNSGHIAFHADLDGGGSGIYFYNGSTATQAFGTSSSIADLGGSPYSLGFFPQLNESDQMTFTAQFAVKNAAFMWQNGTLTEIARSGNGYNGFSHHVDINDSGLMVAQTQRGGWQTVVAMTTSSIGQIISPDTYPDPRGYPHFTHVGTTPVLNNSGMVAFSGVEYGTSKPTGLYLTDSTGSFLNQIYTAPTAHSLYETFAINNNGNVLFMDVTAGTNANTLYTYYNGTKYEVLKTGDVVEGKVVDQIRISSNSLNNNDEIAIYADFFDGSVGVYVAGLSAIPEPASIFLLCGGTLAIWRRRRNTVG